MKVYLSIFLISFTCTCIGQNSAVIFGKDSLNAGYTGNGTDDVLLLLSKVMSVSNTLQWRKSDTVKCLMLVSDTSIQKQMVFKGAKNKTSTHEEDYYDHSLYWIKGYLIFDYSNNSEYIRDENMEVIKPLIIWQLNYKK